MRADEGSRYEPLWLFKTGSLLGDEFDFSVGEVPFHSGPPLHVHDVQHDTFLVLDGTLTLQVGDEVVDLGPGDFATVPPGVPHTFDNLDSAAPVPRVVNLMTPGGLDAFFVGLGDMHDESALNDVGRQHGVSFVGPPLGERFTDRSEKGSHD